MIFAILTLLAALAVASVAGWFSIIGVMAIYAGAPYHAALVMGVVLELAKLVTTSWIYRNWEFANWKLKAPLIYFTAALMLATSIGVFGFLSKSHLEQGAKTIDNGPRVERIEQQIAREKATIADNEKVISQLDATINSYLGKDRTDRSVSIRKNQAPQRKQLKDEIDAANKRIDGFSEEKFKLQSEIRAMELEVGPIRYIAELIYGSAENSTKNIEGAVKIFTLLIVSTLDPLAIILLVAANHTIMRRQNEKKQKTEKNNHIVQEDADRNIKETINSDEGNHISGVLPENDEIDTKIPEMVAPIQEEVVGLVNEEAEITVSENEEDKIILHVPQHDTDSDPIAIIREILEEKPITSTEIETTEEIQEEINEEKVPTLEKFTFAKPSAPLAIIRSPSPSMVSKIDTESKISLGQTMETKVPKAPVEEVKIPWAAQDAVSRELSGWAGHFIPQKVNEEEKNKRIEISETNPETHTSGSEKETQEIPQEGSGKNQISEENKKDDNVSLLARESHKYPKALSWLKEFTRTQNE